MPIKLFILHFLLFTQIWVLEIFPNAKHWWHTKEKSIPRCVAWSDGMKFQKADRESLFYSRTQLNKLEPTPKEMKTQWWSSSVEYFETASTGTPSSDIRGKKKKRKVVKTETHVHTQIHRRTTHVRTEIRSEVDCHGLGEASVGEKLVAMERDIGGRLAAIEKYLKIPKVIYL